MWSGDEITAEQSMLQFRSIMRTGASDNHLGNYRNKWHIECKYVFCIWRKVERTHAEINVKIRLMHLG